jgi:gliding motility-associated protein GldC
MKESKITFSVVLDDKNIPEIIKWEATDNPDMGVVNTNAIALSVWDPNAQNTMRMDLWTKQMKVEEMKRFVVDSVGGMADTIRNATNDPIMAEKMENLCRDLVTHIDEQAKKGKL